MSEKHAGPAGSSGEATQAAADDLGEFAAAAARGRAQLDAGEGVDGAEVANLAHPAIKISKPRAPKASCLFKASS